MECTSLLPVLEACVQNTSAKLHTRMLNKSNSTDRTKANTTTAYYWRDKFARATYLTTQSS